MEKCNVWKFCSVTAAIVFMALLVPMVTAKIDARISIAVILQREHTIGERNEMAAYKKLGTFFESGDEKTRFAIMFYLGSVPKGESRDNHYFDPINPLIMNWMGSSAPYDQEMDSYKMPTDWGPKDGSWPLETGMRDDTLNLVGQKVFPGHGPHNRAQVLFYIVTEPASDLPHRFENYSKELHDIGVWIYMFVRNGEQKDLEIARQSIKWDRIFVSKGREYDKTLADEMVKVKDVILRDLCQWETVCHYLTKERTQCVRESSTSNQYVNDIKQCDPLKSSDPCSQSDCLNECDKRWPGQKEPACGGKCGIKVNGTRGGKAPKYMEHCPTHTWIDCPSCTTSTTSSSTSVVTSTTTPTTTTTPSTSTTSTTSTTPTTTWTTTPTTTTMASTTTTSTTTTAPTTTTTATTTTPPTTTLLLTTTPSTSTRLDATSSKSTHGATTQSSSTSVVVDTSPSVVTESEVTPAGPGGNVDTESPSGGPPIGWIIGGAVGGLIFLILLLLIAILVLKKKKKKPVPPKAVVKGAAPVSREPPKTVPMMKSTDTLKEPSRNEALVGISRKGGEAAIEADISMTHKLFPVAGVGKSTKSDAKIVQLKVEANKKHEPTPKMETGKSKGPTSKMETSKVKAPASKAVSTGMKK